MTELISLKNISKSFGGKLVFCDANMSIKTAEPAVIMGKNGCGKSTLLKIIAGLLKHTGGEITRTPGIKISFAPDRFPKLPFKVEEYMQHMGKIQGLTSTEIDKYITQQFDYLGIPANIKSQVIYKCSKGTIQKINIMQAFLTKSDLLLMDEPFSGLDEGSIERLLQLLAKTAQENTAIIISCHEKLLAQRFTDNMYIFNGQSLAKAVSAAYRLCIKTTAATGQPQEIIIHKDKLNETLTALMQNGKEIYSVNPIKE
ncbi:MAG: ATP-binding cassette domain-containing protein [Defluviitaleaceae bacterium]|nr:ATP-binding cassette domain-containing protein [Defluviitaleaceae bacterium]